RHDAESGRPDGICDGDIETYVPKRTDRLSEQAHQPEHRRKEKDRRQSALEAIAINITALIRRGFPPGYAMTLTPRQIDAFLEFSDRLDRIDRAHALAIARVSAHADKQIFEKAVKELGPK